MSALDEAAAKIGKSGDFFARYDAQNPRPHGAEEYLAWVAARRAALHQEHPEYAALGFQRESIIEEFDAGSHTPCAIVDDETMDRSIRKTAHNRRWMHQNYENDTTHL